MPELAATMPSSPFPATAVDIVSGAPSLGFVACKVENGPEKNLPCPANEYGEKPQLKKKDSKILYSAAIPCLSLPHLLRAGVLPRNQTKQVLPPTSPLSGMRMLETRRSFRKSVLGANFSKNPGQKVCLSPPAARRLFVAELPFSPRHPHRSPSQRKAAYERI
jgi:hypothetical protein